jgi:hypothetical protein
LAGVCGGTAGNNDGFAGFGVGCGL